MLKIGRQTLYQKLPRLLQCKTQYAPQVRRLGATQSRIKVQSEIEILDEIAKKEKHLRNADDAVVAQR